jgi:geranylgeranyl pyrophosphate synthase
MNATLNHTPTQPPIPIATHPIFTAIEPDLQRVLAKMRAAARVDMEMLDEALAYVVAVGGKMVRPALAVTVANLYRPTDDKVISLAASVEMLHTATLVHDDMIDSSARRRGNPTLHTVLDAGSAVLLGDFLFAQAAAWAAQTDNLRVVHIFSETLMTIVGGELRQMWAQFALDRANDDYFHRIYGKTAALFAAACEAGAELGGASKREVESLREYGRLIGLAFQIVDDVLDYTGDAVKMGKPIGADLRNGNITLPVIIYLRDYDQENLAERYFHAKLTPDQAEQVISRVTSSPALRDSLAEARRLAEQAKAQIASLPESDHVERLRTLADYIVARNV